MSLLAVAMLAGPARTGRAAALLPTGFADERRVGDLSQPTSLAFLPDGRLLVTEQWSGNIRLIVAGSNLAPQPVYTQDHVSVNYERGLLSVAVDPGWPARPFIYVHYTDDRGFARVVRLMGQGALADPAGTSLVFGSPYVVLDSLPDNSPIHNGGTTRFGPDGMLYVSLGEDGSACQAQDSTTFHGCVLRLDVRGLPGGAGGPPSHASIRPADNPWAALPDTNAWLVYAYGFRNPFTFQFDRQTGQIFVGDVGEDTWEELDAPAPGSNAGWPHREAFDFVDYPYCPEPGGIGANPYLKPIDHYNHSEGLVIISAGVFRPHTMPTLWPEGWDGAVFYADWWSGTMRMLTYTDGVGWERMHVAGAPGDDIWADGLLHPTDFQWGPDGNLWWTSFQDESQSPGTGALHRIYFNTGIAGVDPNRRHPVLMVAGPNPSRGPTELVYALDAPGRVDLDIFDVSGRKVTTLASAVQTAGAHRVRWDGTGASGRVERNGVYFARLTGPYGTSTVRLVRVR